ncbi:hypothetical protein [Aminobacter sp. Piv2-1]|uniref:hypothetical protein n=1 Tax=Aminobacter sp. Piv2-1 TaxID=3031122 RepID=UPI0030B1A8E2
MTIYHIGKTFELTHAALKRTPTLAAAILKENLSAAAKEYRTSFPTFEKIRHAVSHSSELFRDSENIAKNAFSGDYDDGHIRIENSSNVVVSNSLMGRKYTNTIDGKIISYEISEATKAIVYQCVNTFLSGFKPAYGDPLPSVPAPRW